MVCPFRLKAETIASLYCSTAAEALTEIADWFPPRAHFLSDAGRRPLRSLAGQDVGQHRLFPSSILVNNALSPPRSKKKRPGTRPIWMVSARFDTVGNPAGPVCRPECGVYVTPYFTRLSASVETQEPTHAVRP